MLLERMNDGFLNTLPKAKLEECKDDALLQKHDTYVSNTLIQPRFEFRRRSYKINKLFLIQRSF